MSLRNPYRGLARCLGAGRLGGEETILLMARWSETGGTSWFGPSSYGPGVVSQGNWRELRDRNAHSLQDFSAPNRRFSDATRERRSRMR
jgi:hypothetical protein